MNRLLLFKKPMSYIAGQVKWGARSVIGNKQKRIPDLVIPASVSLQDLVVFLQDQGWQASATANLLTVSGQVETREFLMACDFSTVTPGGLRHDLCEGMKAQGFCSGNCT